jgi:hypothetical protein
MPQKPKAKSTKAKAPVLQSLTVVTKVEKGYHAGSILVTCRQLRFKDGVLVGVELEQRYSIDVS